VISLTRSENSSEPINGVRPVNLRTDLAPLADLIELVFADSMDSGGRAAIREMRSLSQLGPGLHLLSRLNDLAMGVSMGFVWVDNMNIIGNVSVFPANYPTSLGNVWYIANVGVHPDHRGKGIAGRLMEASLQMIRERGGAAAILQVAPEESPARRLYKNLGFVDERSWTTWRRTGSSRMPEPAMHENVYIRHRRRNEWEDEFTLAKRLRPASKGGLGWLRPLHSKQFRPSIWKTIGNWLNLRGLERLVIRSAEDDRLLASMWIESALAGKTQLTLMVDPLFQGIYDDALINLAVRRYGHSAIVIENPNDEVVIANVLSRYNFMQQRQVVHMRLDLR
jgi:ribosomal protein S18 acetylase RimI-like enzyme